MKMKNIFILTALFMGLSFGVQAQKFGHIDAQSLLLSLPERVDAQQTIEAAAQEYEGEMIRMQEELQTKYGDYQESSNLARCNQTAEGKGTPSIRSGSSGIWPNSPNGSSPNGRRTSYSND